MCTPCDNTAQSDREQQFRVIAGRLLALTERCECFIAEQCKRLSTLADATVYVHFAQESCEQKHGELIARIQQERQSLAQAWDRLEIERRQMLCQHDGAIESQRNLGTVTKPVTRSIMVYDDLEQREQADVSTIKQFHQLRQEIEYHSQRVL